MRESTPHSTSPCLQQPSFQKAALLILQPDVPHDHRNQCQSALARPKARDWTPPREATPTGPRQVPTINSVAEPRLLCCLWILGIGEQKGTSSKLNLVPGLPSDTTHLPGFSGSELPPPRRSSRSGWCEPQGQCPCDKHWGRTRSGRIKAPCLTPKGRYTREGREETLPTCDDLG